MKVWVFLSISLQICLVFVQPQVRDTNTFTISSSCRCTDTWTNPIISLDKGYWLDIRISWIKVADSIPYIESVAFIQADDGICPRIYATSLPALVEVRGRLTASTKQSLLNLASCINLKDLDKALAVSSAVAHRCSLVTRACQAALT